MDETKKIAVLYHEDADGFGATYAFWTKYADQAHYIGVQYGRPVPTIPAGVENVYIVDFSYDEETCLDLAAKYHLQIFDHHKSAQAVLDHLCFAHFDAKSSGCRMAWEYLYPTDTEIPTLLAYVEDRDLWKFSLPGSEKINLFVATLPFDFEIWDDYVLDSDFFLDTAISAGTAIKSFRDQQIKSALKSVRLMELVCDAGTFEVPVVNASANISELGNELCVQYPDRPFSISYCDRSDQRSWSLRSIGDFDVSAVAKACGGGGHKNAAGFTTEIGWPGFVSTDFREAFEEGAK